MFQVSDKVVCVDDSPSIHSKALRPLVKGVVYDICGIYNYDPLVGLHLTGVPNFSNAGWDSRRFRKLSDIKAENALRNKQTEPVKVNR